MEEDPKEILHSVFECIEKTCDKLKQLGIDISSVKGINIFLILTISAVKCDMLTCLRKFIAPRDCQWK